MSARGAMITVLATGLSNAIRADEAGDGHDIGAGVFGTAVSAWIRDTVDQIMDIGGICDANRAKPSAPADTHPVLAAPSDDRPPTGARS